FSVSFATSSDVHDIIDFMLSDFLFSRSMNAAIGMTRDDVVDRYPVITKASVSSGTSVVVRNNGGEVIAVRLSGFQDRDQVAAPVDLSQLSPRVVKIRAILSKINEEKWDLIPSDIDRLFEVKLLSVAEKWRGRGIGQILLTFGLNEARERGAKGAFAEAIATASQTIFARSGYSIIREIFYENWLGDDGKPVFVCPDGTQSVQLV
ncbi:hypothetical protein PFISCL1PPCAC_23532, partial [Pristionchus fissidentatus]